MKSELILALNEIIERFGLTQETVLEAVEAAMVSAYRRSANASSAQMVEANIDLETGGVRVFVEKEVVDGVENPQTEVALERARLASPEAEVGEMVMVEATPRNFGRVAAQTAKQVILQRLREAERDAQYDEFVEREGDMVHGTVHSITPQAITIGLGRAEAILPRSQQIPREQFRVRDRVRVYVLEVRKSSRGPVIVVSRTHPTMLRRLLEMEVPEISQGLVEIKGIAREAGKRAKVAVAALREGVDPVGACVGLRGVRIQSIVRDLNDEKIDVIEWNPESSTFIAKALSPARVSGVFLEEDRERGKTAVVVVPEDQLSLAIGRSGVNARLAAKLTGWRIDIKSLPEAASESLHRLEADVEFVDLAGGEGEAVPRIEAIMTKKEEGRPVTPEEYQLLTAFVGRVMGEVYRRRMAERQLELAKLEEVRKGVPQPAYETALEEFDIPTKVRNILTEAGYGTVGQLMEQLGLDEDEILRLHGIGPKAMAEIGRSIEAFVEALPVVEEPEEVIEAVEEAEPVAVGEIVKELAEVVPLAEISEVEPAIAEVGEGVEGVEAVPEAVTEQLEAVPEEISVSVEAAEEVEEAVAAEPVPEVSADLVPEGLGVDRQTEVDLELEEESEEESVLVDDKKKVRRRKRVVEYDPDLGEMVVRRRRKRDQVDEWGEEP